MKKHFWSVIVVPALLAAGLPGARAGEGAGAGKYPSKPIRLIAPFPPGGSADLVARFLGGKLGERLGEQIVVDNRSGATGIIGTDIAARSAADGHTLLIASTTFVMVAAVRALPYEVGKSFDPIALIGSSPNSIVVNPATGFASLRELVDRAKAKPASIFYASTGIAGFNHFGGELFKRLAGIDLVHVPYKGGGPAMIDVIAGQVPMMFTSVTQVLPHLRTGKLKALGVGAARRSPALPEVPTVAEAGYPGYEVAVWWGIMAPAGMPRAVVDRLNREINAILRDPATRERLAAEAAETLPGTPAEFRKFLDDELKKWTEVGKAAGITMQ